MLSHDTTPQDILRKLGVPLRNSKAQQWVSIDEIAVMKGDYPLTVDIWVVTNPDIVGGTTYYQIRLTKDGWEDVVGDWVKE